MDADIPIIYVRGYAGTQSEVETTVDDPFYGFNLGSTHIRLEQDGHAGFYPFPSPLLRLIDEQRYRHVYRETGSDGGTPPRSIWIYRYYDVTARSFELPGQNRLSIEDAAFGLREFIELVRKSTGAKRVHLIAHSMGGLICRCLLQKHYPEGKMKVSGNPSPVAVPEGVSRNPHDYVDRLLTFGTPHGGIDFDMGGGLLEKIRDALGVNDSDVFGPTRMYQFLTPGATAESSPAAGFDAREIPAPPAGGGMLDPERVLCVVGTDAADYAVAHGLSSKMVGPQSDGLVQMDNAYVEKSHRAYIHRSHSGRYGMVNSEEAWQNLERFFFGDLRVKAVLCDFQLDFSTAQKNTTVTYFAETAISVRGLPVVMHERTLAHLSAESLNEAQYREALRKGGLPLFTNFLISERARDGTIRYMIRLALHRQTFKDGFVLIGDHIERLPVWSDQLIVDLSDDPKQPGGINKLSYSWNSESPDPTTPMGPVSEGADPLVFKVPLPQRARAFLGPGANVSFQASSWPKPF